MKNSPEIPFVAVIGAGMAGLTAAYELAKNNIRAIVFEKSSRVGGRVHTDTSSGFQIETGAQSYFRFYHQTRRLIQELNLERDEVSVLGNPGIIRDRQIFNLSPNLNFLFSNLISLRSKLLLRKFIYLLLSNWSNLDYNNLPEAYRLDTRTVSEYTLHELNHEILNYIFEPILSGIYYWKPEEVSQSAIFVLFRQVLFGLQLMTLRQGLGTLPMAMAQHLDVQLNTVVDRVVANADGKYSIIVQHKTQKTEYIVDGVVCATPATEVTKVIPSLDKIQQSFFNSIRYSSNVSVAIQMLNDPLPMINSLFVPRVERYITQLGAVTHQTNKYMSQNSSNSTILSLFSSAQSGINLIGESNEKIAKYLISDFRSFIASEDHINTLSNYVYRWNEALPIFSVGYFHKLKNFKTNQIKSGNIVFAGDYLEGPFIEGAVTSGLAAAKQLLNSLRS